MESGESQEEDASAEMYDKEREQRQYSSRNFRRRDDTKRKYNALKDKLRATQEELGTKMRELQTYETHYAKQKKDVRRWKKKFDYVFRENELLSHEAKKLNQAHRQIQYQEKLKSFKEEENRALKRLVKGFESALKREKKQKDKLNHELQQARDQVRASEESVAILQQSQASIDLNNSKSEEDWSNQIAQDEYDNLKHQLEQEKQQRQYMRDELNGEIESLRNELDMAKQEVSSHKDDNQRREEKLKASYDRVKELEQQLQEASDSHLQQLQDKQEQIAQIETELSDLRVQAESNKQGPGFDPTDDGEEDDADEKDDDRENEEEDDRSVNDCDDREEAVFDDDNRSERDDSDPSTPPGTPPRVSEESIFRTFDPYEDQVIQDWENDKSIQAAASGEVDMDRLQAFFDYLPPDNRAGVRQILEQALLSDLDAPLASDMQILLPDMPKIGREELKEYVIPRLKAHKQLRVTLSTLERRTVVTDVRLKLERREDGNLDMARKDFGHDHEFYGPSSVDPTKQVKHTKRVISGTDKPSYVSYPMEEESADEAPPQPSLFEEAPPSDDGNDVSTPGSQSKSSNATVPATPVPTISKGGSGLFGAFTKLRAATRFVQTSSTQEKIEHTGTTCQYCKQSPIIGGLYSCATCVNLDLCENCYALGGHGLENSDELFHRVQDLALNRCVSLQEEVEMLELLRFEICKSNLRKFAFVLNWLADVVNGKSSKDLQARALEIPNVRRDVRKEFVPQLLEVCSVRQDIEIRVEWELESDNNAQAHSAIRDNEDANGDGAFLETLRIWVADQYRTTSPFVERSLQRYRDGEVDKVEVERKNTVGTMDEEGVEDVVGSNVKYAASEEL